MSATVLGDVPMKGVQVACGTCHGRGGMGSPEQGDRTPGIASPVLFVANRDGSRPAYTEASLARALRDGIDAAGRPLDPLMPRLQLSDDDMAALISYLRELGSDTPPGFLDDKFRVATVLAGDLREEDKVAVTDVLHAYVAAHNEDTRGVDQRAETRQQRGRVVAPFKKMELDVWTLRGTSDTWREQLEERYAEAPVFAMVGGLGDGDWEPIHRFCEDHRMPCVLPITDEPPALADDFYSLYFTEGVRLDANIVAADILANQRQANVVQVVLEESSRARRAAELVAERVVAGGGAARTVWVDGGYSGLARALDGQPSAVVLWVGQDALGKLPAGSSVPFAYLSSSMLEQDWNDLPDPWRAQTRIVEVERLPGQRDSAVLRYKAWARARGIIERDLDLQSRAWYASMVFGHSLKHVFKYPQRDFLLDVLDHSDGLMAYLPLYPRGNFGPGQRTIVKGGHLIDPTGASRPVWVNP